MYTEGGMVCRAQEAHYIPLSHVAEGEPDVPPQPVHKSDTVRSCLSNQAKSSRLLSVTEAPAEGGTGAARSHCILARCLLTQPGPAKADNSSRV